jgi:hypothetical protein
VQKLNIPDLDVENWKEDRYDAELTEITKSEQSGAGLHNIYMSKFSVSNKHIHFCVAFVVHEPQCKSKPVFLNNFCTFID